MGGCMRSPHPNSEMCGAPTTLLKHETQQIYDINGTQKEKVVKNFEVVVLSSQKFMTRQTIFLARGWSCLLLFAAGLKCAETN